MKNVIIGCPLVLHLKISTVESYTYIPFLQVKMRTLKDNIYYTILTLSGELCQKTYENIKRLISQESGKSTGVLYSMFHTIFVLGPKKFHSFPTAISIGRAFFLPLVFLFKKSQWNQK
jgi:hypothetical protein